jgi:N-methylhydantoinase A
VHAFAVASILHSPQIILPLGAGVGSTIGSLTAPLAFDFVRTSIEPLDEIDWDRVNALRREMEHDGIAPLTRSGVTAAQITVSCAADLRYLGQGHEVTVPLPNTPLGPESRPRIIEDFGDVYRRLYGRVADGIPLEAVNWRVVVSGPTPSLDLAQGGLRGDALKGTRRVYSQE